MKYRADLNEWIEQRQKDHFSDLSHDSLAKRFLSYSNKRTEQILNLTKTEIKIKLRYHMHRIGKGLTTHADCAWKRVKQPSTLSVSDRLWLFGKGFMSPQTVKSWKPKSKLGFLKAVQFEEIKQFGLFSQKILLGRSGNWSPSFKKTLLNVLKNPHPIFTDSKTTFMIPP
jgi:hypothetical protein